MWRTVECWLSYTDAEAAGFPVGGVTGTDTYGLRVTDTGRLNHLSTDSGTELWGVGYRLLIEVSDRNALRSTTLPAIAAACELDQLVAYARVEVNGCSAHALWSVDPGPVLLDLEGAATINRRIEEVRLALSAAPPELQRPVLLGRDQGRRRIQRATTPAPVQVETVDESVVLVGLVHGVALGQKMGDAASNLTMQSQMPEERVHDLASQVYGLLGHESGHPTPDGVRRAQGALAPLQ